MYISQRKKIIDRKHEQMCTCDVALLYNNTNAHVWIMRLCKLCDNTGEMHKNQNEYWLYHCPVDNNLWPCIWTHWPRISCFSDIFVNMGGRGTCSSIKREPVKRTQEAKLLYVKVKCWFIPNILSAIFYNAPRKNAVFVPTVHFIGIHINLNLVRDRESVVVGMEETTLLVACYRLNKPVNQRKKSKLNLNSTSNFIYICKYFEENSWKNIEEKCTRS